jgi:hypothetical protein
MSTCDAVVGATSTFLPLMRLILSISQSSPATITTTLSQGHVGVPAVAGDHNYTSGLVVRLNIPQACGMQQLNGYTGVITVTGTTTFTIDVDSTFYDAFAIPAVPNPVWIDTCAQVLPIAENNDMISEATRNILF